MNSVVDVYNMYSDGFSFSILVPADEGILNDLFCGDLMPSFTAEDILAETASITTTSFIDSNTVHLFPTDLSEQACDELMQDGHSLLLEALSVDHSGVDELTEIAEALGQQINTENTEVNRGKTLFEENISEIITIIEEDSLHSSSNIETSQYEQSLGTFHSVTPPESPISRRLSNRPGPYPKSKPKTPNTKVKLDKKERKRGQNKTAATRYRQKKKAEKEHVYEEVTDLEDKNEMLKGKVDQLSQEIIYVKDLIAEVYVAKGLIKSKSELDFKIIV